VSDRRGKDLIVEEKKSENKNRKNGIKTMRTIDL
jgi:hypothetical protein